MIATRSQFGNITFWSEETKEEIYSFNCQPSPFTVNSVAFANDGTKFVAASDKQIKLLDLSSRSEIMSHEHCFYILSVNFDHSGDRVVFVSDMEICVWNLSANEIFVVMEKESAYFYIPNAVFTVNDMLVVSANRSHEVVCWNLSGEKVASMKGHSRDIHAVASSPVDSLVASASADYSIRLWDTDTLSLKMVLNGHWDEVWSVCFSFDGRMVASCSAEDDTARIWSCADGSLLLTMNVSQALSARLNSTGSRLAVRTNQEVRIFDINVVHVTDASLSLSSGSGSSGGEEVIPLSMGVAMCYCPSRSVILM